MVAFRSDPPPDDIRDLIEYKEGAIYWTEQAKKDVKTRKDGPLGCVDHFGYLYTNLRAGENNKRRRYFIHRLIYWLVTDEWPEVIDHKDRNRLNNDFDNLRASTVQKNCRNRSNQTGSKSDFVGVHPTPNNNYRVSVRIAGKQYFISGYKDEKTAALARDILAHMFYGDFANLNLLNNNKVAVDGVAI
ncbi:HNH endonuclease [Salmonella enterica]|nr:HNH endonuclease [Salmonella enterica]